MADSSKRLAIDIEADAKQAQRILKEVADDVKQLEDAYPVVEVKADSGNADKVLADLLAEAKELDAQKVKLDVTVDQAALDKTEGSLKGIGDQADHMGKEVNAQVGPMRDMAGALGNTGGAALDASEGILGLGETLENMGGSLGKVGGLLAKGGFFAAIATFATEAAFAAANAVTGANRKIEQSQASVVASTLRGNEAIIDSTQRLVREQGDLFEFSDLWTDFGETTKFAGDQASRSIEDIDQALDKFKDNPAIMRKVLAAFRETVQGLDQTSDAYRENMDILTQREAELRRLMEATAAQAKADADYAQEQEVLNQAALLGLTIAGKSVEALEEEVSARNKAKEAMDATTQGIRDNMAAQRDLRSTLRDTTSALFDQNDKARANRQAWRDYDQTLKDVKEDSKITAEEMDTLTAAVDDVADSALAVDDNAQDAINALKLMATGNLPPGLAAYIAGLIKQLEDMKRKADAALITFEKAGSGYRGGNQPLMAGSQGLPQSGFYDVGEAGRERVWLPKGAQVDNAYVTAAQGGGPSAMAAAQVTYLTINVRVEPGSQPADIGRVLVSQLEAYERANGRRVLVH